MYAMIIQSKSREIVVAGYIRQCEVELNIKFPQDIRQVLGLFCTERATLEQLVAARKYATLLGKEHYVAQSIIETICRRDGSKYNLTDDELDALHAILEHPLFCKMNEFTDGMLLQFARIAMYLSHERVLKMVINKWVGVQNVLLDKHKESLFMREILIYGVKNELYETVEMLFMDKSIDLVVFVPRPKCLLEALKKRDNKMFEIVLN